MIQFHSSDRPASLHTREGLSRYLETTIVKPTVIPADELASLPKASRDAYNRSRILYLSGGILLNTPYLTEAKLILEDCFAENIGRNSGHAGLLVTGDSTLGKTTIAKALMKWALHHYEAFVPDYRDYDQIPVIYICVPAASTGKLLMKTFAQFFGLTVRSGESMGNIRSRVVEAIRAAGTQLIVVDEVQNLAGRSSGKGDSVDLLKELSNEVPATFVYAGIDLAEGNLLAGSRGKQVSGRFAALDMVRFNRSNTDDRRIWRGLVSAFEDELLLNDHERGSLPALCDYLFDRTGGSIGSLGRLLTGSAIEAINNPRVKSERLDRNFLDARRLDLAAETAYVASKTRAARKSTAAAIAESMAA
jgi:hypothetical protein